MTSRRRLLLAALALAAGVASGAVPPMGSAASAQDLLWATRAGGTSDDEGRGIATTARGDSYVTGVFRGTATFGPGDANETTLTAAGSIDIFVAKYR